MRRVGVTEEDAGTGAGGGVEKKTCLCRCDRY